MALSSLRGGMGVILDEVTFSNFQCYFHYSTAANTSQAFTHQHLVYFFTIMQFLALINEHAYQFKTFLFNDFKSSLLALN